jgi:predicted membrane chloride channel (bestrophin family)
MGLDVIWHQFIMILYQLWIWVSSELAAHPFIIIGTLIVLFLAWKIYTIEVRTK